MVNIASVTVTVCSYVLLVPTCQHNPIVLFDTSRRLILKELQRIKKPAVSQGSALFEISFRVPEPCYPRKPLQYSLFFHCIVPVQIALTRLLAVEWVDQQRPRGMK